LDNDNIKRLKKIVDRLSPEDGEYICRAIYKDPFTDIYPILSIIYVFILGIFLLWPFDFDSHVKNDARWIGNSNGIEFLNHGQAVSESSSREFFDRLVKGKGLTLELWLQTEDLTQSGPARILSYSINPVLRNFTVGQSRDKLVVKLRTTKTNLNGTDPQLVIADTFNSTSLQHIVIIYDFTEQRVYINGDQKARSNILKGNFSNWDRSCSLVVGNEATGDRPWKGKIYYAAVFDRALTEHEIRQYNLSGSKLNTSTFPPVLWKKDSSKDIALKSKNPVARYLFDEKKGIVIHDSGSVSSPVNLLIPRYIRHRVKSFLDDSIDYLRGKAQLSDIILNILIFIPLGILMHGMLRTRYRLTLKISIMALLAGALFSVSVESLQHFSMTRNSSLIDVATNMTGAAMGIVMDRCYNLFLNYRAKHLRMLICDRKE